MSSIKVVFNDDKQNIYIDDTYIGNIIYVSFIYGRIMIAN